jgi:hypothetical protein
VKKRRQPRFVVVVANRILFSTHGRALLCVWEFDAFVDIGSTTTIIVVIAWVNGPADAILDVEAVGAQQTEITENNDDVTFAESQRFVLTELRNIFFDPRDKRFEFGKKSQPTFVQLHGRIKKRSPPYSYCSDVVVVIVFVVVVCDPSFCSAGILGQTGLGCMGHLLLRKIFTQRSAVFGAKTRP